MVRYNVGDIVVSLYDFRKIKKTYSFSYIKN